MSSRALINGNLTNRLQIFNLQVENNEDLQPTEEIYKVVYYDGDEFVNGNYDVIKQNLGKYFIDIVKLYDSENKTTVCGSISWNDILLTNPVGRSDTVASELIVVSINDTEVAGFVGGYVSSDGYYKANLPQIITETNSSFTSTKLFTKIKIEKNDTTQMRKVTLYKAL